MSVDEDLSAYLAGELTPQARACFESRLARDPRLAREAADLAALARQLEGLPREAWALAPAPEPRRRTRRRWTSPTLRLRGTVAAAAAVCALAVGLVAGILLERSPQPRGVTIALRPLGPHYASVTATAKLTVDGRILIAVSGLSRPDIGHYYEAWLMSSPTKLIALGSFRTDRHGNGALATVNPAPVHAFRYIDISLQRLDGGPAHSTESVLRGSTAAL